MKAMVVGFVFFYFGFCYCTPLNAQLKPDPVDHVRSTVTFPKGNGGSHDGGGAIKSLPYPVLPDDLKKPNSAKPSIFVNTDYDIVLVMNGLTYYIDKGEGYKQIEVRNGNNNFTVAVQDNKVNSYSDIVEIPVSEFGYVGHLYLRFGALVRVEESMKRVEGGWFDMGSRNGSSDELPVRQVYLGDYFIGQSEVTVEMWNAISSAPIESNCLNCPVVNISWDEVQKFINELNRLAGGAVYRLPTEAEWEYAARGGQYTSGYEYAGSNSIWEVAWYKENSSGNLSQCKSRQRNELGLYDMSGNVWEWCLDYYADKYPETQTRNPHGVSYGTERVIRGGSVFNSANACRVSYRDKVHQGHRSQNIGFRLVKVVSVD